MVRKNLKDISDKAFKKKRILCPVIREGFERYVWENGGLTKAKKTLSGNPFIHPKTRDKIRRVKILYSENFNEESYWQKTDGNEKPLFLVSYQNYHHVEIIKNLKSGKHESKFIATMEAAARARRYNKPIVETNHIGAEFVMSLCINDTVSIKTKTEKVRFYRVQKLEQSTRKIVLRLLNAATLENKEEEISAKVQKLMTDFGMKKESINALGRRLTNANP